MLTNGAESCEPLVHRTPDRNREGLVHALIKLARLAKSLVSIKHSGGRRSLYPLCFVCKLKKRLDLRQLFFLNPNEVYDEIQEVEKHDCIFNRVVKSSLS